MPFPYTPMTSEIIELKANNAKLRALLEDALLVLEVQFGKKAKPGSLIYQIRKALAKRDK